MVDEDGLCVTCDSGKYNSNGYCCDDRKFFNGVDCVDISIDDNCV